MLTCGLVVFGGSEVVRGSVDVGALSRVSVAEVVGAYGILHKFSAMFPVFFFRFFCSLCISFMRESTASNLDCNLETRSRSSAFSARSVSKSSIPSHRALHLLSARTLTSSTKPAMQSKHACCSTGLAHLKQVGSLLITVT